MQFTLTNPQLAIKAECKVCWTNDRGRSGLSFLGSSLRFPHAAEESAVHYRCHPHASAGNRSQHGDLQRG